MEIIHSELRLKDEEFLKKTVQTLEPVVKRAGIKADKAKVFELEVAKKALEFVSGDSGRDIRLGDWSNKEVEVLNSFTLITAKPVVYLVNISEKDYVCRELIRISSMARIALCFASH